jgi:DNA polymerase-3 subunit gamma/tau
MAEGNELYKRYRPTTFKDVVGQASAVKSLVDMGKRNEIPHALLFTGPSGCGKTTLARILRAKLKCSDHDFQEINAADFRGIDSIRVIRQQMGAAPLMGTSRVWLLDEAHNLSGDAQTALLKILEDTPGHVYFMLATTDPQKLKKTIITRCTEVRCKEITKKELSDLALRIAAAENVTISGAVAEKLADVAEGSARKVLVLLHAVIGLKDEEDQLAAIEAGDVKGQAIEIARALLNQRTTWNTMKGLLKAVEEEPESIRHLVLSYCTSVLLNSENPRAALVIEEFRDPYYDTKKAGLVLSCWNVIKG